MYFQNRQSFTRRCRSSSGNQIEIPSQYIVTEPSSPSSNSNPTPCIFASNDQSSSSSDIYSSPNKLPKNVQDIIDLATKKNELEKRKCKDIESLYPEDKNSELIIDLTKPDFNDVLEKIEALDKKIEAGFNGLFKRLDEFEKLVEKIIDFNNNVQRIQFKINGREI